jgi:hypothetical protein
MNKFTVSVPEMSRYHGVGAHLLKSRARLEEKVNMTNECPCLLLLIAMQGSIPDGVFVPFQALWIRTIGGPYAWGATNCFPCDCRSPPVHNSAALADSN